jgi:hypothetical protein
VSIDSARANSFEQTLEERRETDRSHLEVLLNFIGDVEEIFSSFLFRNLRPDGKSFFGRLNSSIDIKLRG